MTPDRKARLKVLALGDLLLDLVVRYDPRSGEADTGPEAAQIWPGGSAANFAVQAARLGADVRFVGRVGRDWAGDMLVRSLQRDGVTASVVASEKEATGRVLVMVDPEGHRRMWSYPGASAAISGEDLDPEWFVGLDTFHLTGYSLLREGPSAAALDALRLAKEGGCAFCTFDPNPPHLIQDFGSGRFRDLVAGLAFDALFPNIEEGRLLTGRQTPEEVAHDLLQISPLVALTLGREGCLVASKSSVIEVEAHPPDRVADATGAGDAFAAGFVIEYLRSHDLRIAAEAANALAAGVVGRMGAR